MESQNIALITGASSGIGMELAKIHASKGGDLVLVARSVDKLKQLQKELENTYHISVTVIGEDLSTPDSAQRIFDHTEKQGMIINTLINNAGFGGRGLFHMQDFQDAQSMMQVNMTALTQLTHLYLQGMVERRQGRILNVSSVASFIPGPMQAIYHATKAFVTSFTEAVAEEVATYNVTATALCPGAVATGFAEAANLGDLQAFKHARSAKSVAECGYQAMERGQLVAFNQGSLKFFLTWVAPLLPRKVILNLARSAMEK